MAPVLSTQAILAHTFRDILSLFSRRSLFKLLGTCRIFRNIISNEFPSSPYLRFDHLYYANGLWTIRDYSPLLEVDVPSLSMPYLRFHDILIIVDKSEIDFLLSICHVWHDRNLTIICNAEFTPIKEFAVLIATCRSLTLSAYGCLSMLQYLLNGKCKQLVIRDRENDPTVLFPFEDVAEFLFNAKQEPNDRKLKIGARPFPELERFSQFACAAKQKFEQANIPLKFSFAITIRNYDNKLIPEDFMVHNSNIKQSMRLRSWNDGLELKTPLKILNNNNNGFYDEEYNDISEDDLGGKKSPKNYRDIPYSTTKSPEELSENNFRKQTNHQTLTTESVRTSNSEKPVHQTKRAAEKKEGKIEQTSTSEDLEKSDNETNLGTPLWMVAYPQRRIHR
ncbi:hypothetical protein DdX_06629 [Ditylenchus destructor]|uniref:F-box domain-containing protein n=1 Tax=Ditylenchus destructor TaxID=166010 RepID=A0AAD4NBD9_9BILA|nr:hypothetical protein DdX_06629 [Ditylenchus destructor]